MRILFFFIRLAVLAAVLGVFIYFVGGTLWLKIGSYGFQQDIQELPLLSKKVTEYTQVCQNAPQSSDNSIPLGFQLRFLNDQEYVTEVVCSLIENVPIEIKRGKLPPLLTKAPGSAGIYYPLEQTTLYTSSLRLKSINKELGFSLEGDVFKMGLDIQPLAGLYPKAECNAFGYACCNSASEIGKNQLIGKMVTDCPTNCFAACKSVPFVALFNSDPPYDSQTREIALTTDNLSVLFNYSINPKTVTSVHIDYGDGTGEDSQYADGIFTHTYACMGGCHYTVSLTSKDADGVSSLETGESKIYIVRR